MVKVYSKLRCNSIVLMVVIIELIGKLLSLNLFLWVLIVFKFAIMTIHKRGF